MTPCDCTECDERCDQYAEAYMHLCYDCSNEEHIQDRDQ